MITTKNLDEHVYGLEIRNDNNQVLYELPSMYAGLVSGRHHGFCIPIYEDMDNMDDYDYGDFTFISLGYDGIAEGLTKLMLGLNIAVPVLGVVGRFNNNKQLNAMRNAADEGRLFLKTVD